MIHSITFMKSNTVLGPLPLGHELRYVSRKGWEDEPVARGKAGRMLKRDNPEENLMCWEVISLEKA